MARPNKKGLDFYRCNTNRYQDSKIKRLIFKYKSDGIAVWDFILNEIYRIEGSYISFDDNLVFLTADSLRITEELVDNIIKYCIEINLFSKEILEKTGFLTSISIQQFYKEAAIVSKRKVVNIPELIQLIQEETIIKNEKKSETAEKLEEIPQHNITEHNITEPLFIYSEKSKIQPFFKIANETFSCTFSSYLLKNYQPVFEAELIRRMFSHRAAEVLNKLDEKYNFSEFENSRHVINALKSFLDNLDAKNGNHKPLVPVRNNQKQLTNWNAGN